MFELSSMSRMLRINLSMILSMPEVRFPSQLYQLLLGLLLIG